MENNLDLETLLERYILTEIESDQLRTLLSLIIDNASLSWDEKGLTVSSEVFMPYIRAIAPNDYKRRFYELKKENEANNG